MIYTGNTQRQWPDFIIIGAAKSGTTSLHELLDQHDQIYMSRPKEPHFFSFDKRYAKGPKWYASYFRDARPGQVKGETSPSYSDRITYPLTADRINSHAPWTKLIFIVRNPLDRIASHWCMLTRYSGEVPSFKRSMKDERFNEELIGRSKYWFQLQAYRRYWSDNQIKILFFEDLKSDPLPVLNQCASFIGIRKFRRLENPMKAHNKGKDLAAGRSETRALHKLRKIKALMTVKQFLPDILKKTIWELPVFTREKETKARWDHNLKSEVKDKIRHDSLRLLKYAGKPLNYWNLD